METPLTRGDTLRVQPLADGLCVSGVVDLSSIEQLRTSLSGLDHHDGDAHLYLRDVTFIDVAGVTEIVRLAWRIQPGRRVLLHDVSDEFRRVLEVMYAVPCNVWMVP